MKPLRYFFFRNYQLNLKQRSPMPWFRPLGLLSALSGINALVVVLICNEIWGGDATIERRELALKVLAPAWTVMMFTMLYFRWINSGHYLRFKEEFGNESTRQRKLRALLLVVYAVVTICSPAVTGYWIFMRGGGR